MRKRIDSESSKVEGIDRDGAEVVVFRKPEQKKVKLYYEEHDITIYMNQSRYEAVSEDRFD